MKSLVRSLSSLFMTLLVVALTVLGNLTCSAATKQRVSEDYIDKCFTSVAAASCLGVYLPENSTEFNYLRAYGWRIMPQKLRSGRVESNFAIAHNYFPELKKRIFLVTFRGSANKKDWSINLKTNRINYGGHTLAEMEAIAKEPLRKAEPAVHSGFNTYVDTVMRTSVLDDKGQLRGVFKAVAERSDAMMILSGHSLGGAAATLLSQRLLDLGMPPERLCVVTFGAPAVGNEAFANAYGARLRLLRITNTADPVPGSLQTFFGGYKQFGRHIKYSLSSQVGNMHHDMAMYFDYSVSDYYEEFDRQVALGRLFPVPDRKMSIGVPVVALWIIESENLKKVATNLDLKRFVTDEYKRMLPSYIVMDKALDKEGYTHQNVVEKSRLSGADYILICGIDGYRQPEADGWYLTLEQSLFDEQGRMLTMSSLGRKVLPAVGNIQAVGESLMAARKELHSQLPFVMLNFEPRLAQQ
ncbi:MAG: lipase family protein [Phascolarctobacterium sp.]|nr:lipase family protein [Phascolarctobacterium sp.]